VHIAVYYYLPATLLYIDGLHYHGLHSRTGPVSTGWQRRYIGLTGKDSGGTQKNCFGTTLAVWASIRLASGEHG